MKNSPEIIRAGIASVLSISPIEEDHFVLQDILKLLDGSLDPHRTFLLKSCSRLSTALSTLRDYPYEVVVCERDLLPGSWKDVLDLVTIVPDPPPLIVTSRLADERLWAEVLNLGAFDVIAKPFDLMETMRVIGAAWRAWGGRLRARKERPKHMIATAGGTM